MFRYEYPLKKIRPKEDFVKIMYSILGMFFDKYKDRKNELELTWNGGDTFIIVLHWQLTPEEKKRLDELIAYYNGEL